MRKESQTEEKEREQINEMKVEEGKSYPRQKVLIRHAQ